MSNAYKDWQRENLVRDRYLTEQVLGQTWHRCDEMAFHCDDCEKQVPKSPDFSSPEGFFPLLDAMRARKNLFRILRFQNLGGLGIPDETKEMVIPVRWLKPGRFADDVYEFMLEQGKEIK
jgi:hypothetical protein